MNGLDILLVLAGVLAAVGGWRLGLVTRALGWAGAILGLALAVTLVPVLADWLNPPSDTGVLLLGAGLFVLLASAGQAIGVAIGSRLRPEPHDAVVRHLDAVGGAALGVVGVVLMIWLMVPVMAGTEGFVASSTRNSAIARAVSDHMPSPPPQIAELERSLVGGRFPELFAGLRPAPQIPPPPEGSPVSQSTLHSASLSTARLQSRACDLVQSGSGFSVGNGLWVTNAHVVAGAGEIDLSTPDGATGRGRVVAFDPRVDLAVVRADLVRPALILQMPAERQGGLALGYPGGGPFEPAPFLIGDQLVANGYDIYDDTVVRRNLLVLAAELHPGDSGSALIDGSGHVLGVAVAVAPDKAGVAYALRADAVQRIIAAAGSDPVSSGACLR